MAGLIRTASCRDSCHLQWFFPSDLVLSLSCESSRTASYARSFQTTEMLVVSPLNKCSPPSEEQRSMVRVSVRCAALECGAFGSATAPSQWPSGVARCRRHILKPNDWSHGAGTRYSFIYLCYDNHRLILLAFSVEHLPKLRCLRATQVKPPSAVQARSSPPERHATSFLKSAGAVLCAKHGPHRYLSHPVPLEGLNRHVPSFSTIMYHPLPTYIYIIYLDHPLGLQWVFSLPYTGSP